MRLFEKVSRHVKPKRLLADPQYSSQSLRDAALKQGTVPVIPYPRKQQKSVKGILRIGRKFKSLGPQQLRRAYRKRVAVERVFSRLKNFADLTQHNLRGLAKVTFHTQLCARETRATTVRLCSLRLQSFQACPTTMRQYQNTTITWLLPRTCCTPHGEETCGLPA
jgi:hypothetical protein